jgi:hypothetical protein
MENAPELARLFPPAVRTWLVARGCDDARWVPAGDRPPPPEGVVCLDFAVDFAASPMRWLVLRLHFSQGPGLLPSEGQLLADYLASIAPFLGASGPDQRDPWLTLSRETLLVVEHQLRNHLNSLLMNAAVLSLHAGINGHDPVLEQMETDGQRCLDMIQQLLHPPG